MWGGGFSETPAADAWDFTVDLSDRRLLVHDITGSLAHIRMLAASGHVDESDAKALVEGLERLMEAAEAGTFEFQPDDEDVHSAVERRLYELVGPAAGKLHTGRSRNDQVALDLRLYLRDAGAVLEGGLKRLATALIVQARRHRETLSPAYTHLQQSQPVPFGHHLLAHAWPLTRDLQRFKALAGRLDESPLGAGASAGSSLSLDPRQVADELGFSRTFDNSLDAISSRDLASEFVYCCAQAMANLSRLAADVVLWATREFGWMTIADAYATGSSAMPHKKNPDIAELVRGKAAAVAGDLMTLVGLQHGLPLSYNRDLQEDKRAVFHAADSLNGATGALTGLIATAEFHPQPPAPETAALDVAEALVRDGVPFREAHRLVGELVARLAGDGRSLAEAGAADLAAVSDLFQPEHLVTPEAAVALRMIPGAGSPDSVDQQIDRLEALLA